MSVQELSERLPRLKTYLELMKLRLSSLVILSGVLGYIYCSKGDLDLSTMWWFCIGGLLLTGAANVINQIIEVDLDRLMNRTKVRPLPSYKLTVQEAIVFCILLFALGFGVLISFVNAITAFYTLISVILYAFVYTPLKRISPFAVFIGAFPGALPPLLGDLAANGQITFSGLIVFSIQFIWQFPHFWAIAWILDEDYNKAGFKLLPSSEGKSKNTVIHIMVYTLTLIPLGIIPYYFGMSGPIYLVSSIALGVYFSKFSVDLFRYMDAPSARKLMFASFIYLPLIQIVMIIDKWIFQH